MKGHRHMHGLLGLGALLALVSFAFGPKAAVGLAQAILIGGTLFMLWIAYLVIFDRI